MAALACCRARVGPHVGGGHARAITKSHAGRPASPAGGASTTERRRAWCAEALDLGGSLSTTELPRLAIPAQLTRMRRPEASATSVARRTQSSATSSDADGLARRPSPRCRDGASAAARSRPVGDALRRRRREAQRHGRPIPHRPRSPAPAAHQISHVALPPSSAAPPVPRPPTSDARGDGPAAAFADGRPATLAVASGPRSRRARARTRCREHPTARPTGPGRATGRARAVTTWPTGRRCAAWRGP